jgi:uncharacterized OB-fold protein
MTETTSAPRLGNLEIPIDTWTEPFWEGTAQQQLLVPRCGQCGRVRWPAGPFCPGCQSQQVDWIPAGPAQVYSFTVVRQKGEEGSPPHWVAPALIEFPDTGVRIVAAIVDAPVADIAIGRAVEVCWRSHRGSNIPMFRLAHPA